MLPIGEGKRAMSIEVKDLQGVEGYLKPGSHVDVAAKLTVPNNAKSGQFDAETLLIQNVKVLALGHAADDEASKKRYQNITLEVSPKDALTLAFTSKYEFYLLLRKDGDEKLEPNYTHVFENQLREGVFLK
jgi:pilus assembly protein CpaB